MEEENQGVDLFRVGIQTSPYPYEGKVTKYCKLGNTEFCVLFFMKRGWWDIAPLEGSQQLRILNKNRPLTVAGGHILDPLLFFFFSVLVFGILYW